MAGPRRREGQKFKAISSSWQHTCGLREDGTAVCWGRDESGQASPSANERFVEISTNLYHTCALRADGTPECWGAANSSN